MELPTYEVAHVREQGVDLIIVPVKSSFQHMNSSGQDALVAELQVRAAEAGLAGTVVPVWEESGGRMGFRAPTGFHPFFKSIDLGVVAANINTKLYW
jgi:hypothetical protein